MTHHRTYQFSTQKSSNCLDTAIGKATATGEHQLTNIGAVLGQGDDCIVGQLIKPF